jgi:excisionase family DNA binding protein
MTPRLLTLAEVAERLGVSLQTVRREVADGRLKTTPVRSLVRVTENELARYVGQTKLDSANPWDAILANDYGPDQTRHA